MKTIVQRTLVSRDGKKRIPLRLELADTFWKKFRGLMMRDGLPAGTGLYFSGTNSIHMCFMKFAIDVVYFDKTGTVVKLVRHLRPWLGLSACLSARSCLEMKAGEIERLGIEVGMKMSAQ